MLTEMIKNRKIFLEEEISWPKGKWKSLVFLRFTIFENIEKWSYSFLFARGERSELESAELFPGRCFRARLGSKGTKRAIDSKSRMGKWWNIYTNIYILCSKKNDFRKKFRPKIRFRDERKRLLSSSIESKPRSNTHTHETHELGTRRNAPNILMKPKRLGDLAQAKYVGQNENVPRGPGHEGRRSRWEWKQKCSFLYVCVI